MKLKHIVISGNIGVGKTTLAEKLAKKAQEKKISKIYFDRGQFKYHGRVKSLAEASRKGGLKF